MSVKVGPSNIGIPGTKGEINSQVDFDRWLPIKIDSNETAIDVDSGGSGWGEGIVFECEIEPFFNGLPSENADICCPDDRVRITRAIQTGC